MPIKPRFQEKIDVVKEHIKNPCADLLAVEVKFKNLKKDITKAKRTREQNANNEPSEETPEPSEPPRKRRRGKTSDVVEPQPKPKAKAKNARKKRNQS